MGPGLVLAIWVSFGDRVPVRLGSAFRNAGKELIGMSLLLTVEID